MTDEEIKLKEHEERLKNMHYNTEYKGKSFKELAEYVTIKYKHALEYLKDN